MPRCEVTTPGKGIGKPAGLPLATRVVSLSHGMRTSMCIASACRSLSHDTLLIGLVEQDFALRL